MSISPNRPCRFLTLGLCSLLPRTALAEIGAPTEWQWWHQPPVTPAMERLDAFHWLLFGIMIGICVLVMALLAYVVLRYRESRNPNPSRVSHNTVIEVIWTVLPVALLLIIALPSFRTLYYTAVVPEADMTVKAIGHQWYWSYEYPDHAGVSFDQLMVQDADLEPGQPRLLATDNNLVVPVGATVRVQVTADDVLHAWAVPSFGVKMDAIPGRLNETWFKAEREGIYYGQCSEICGTNHAYMPITVEVVPRERFDTWIAEKKAALADTGRRIAKAGAE